MRCRSTLLALTLGLTWQAPRAFGLPWERKVRDTDILESNSSTDFADSITSFETSSATDDGDDISFSAQWNASSEAPSVLIVVPSTSLVLTSVPPEMPSETPEKVSGSPNSLVIPTTIAVIASGNPTIFTTVSPIGPVATTSSAIGRSSSTPSRAVTAMPSIPSVGRDNDIPETFIRGVNVGGWLVLEKWMVEDVFARTKAVDQWTFDSLPGAEEKLQSHWETFFTQADVVALKATGINAIRIPIGYWAYDNSSTPYLKGADAYLEKAIGWARAAGMRVWIDCHGSPGSQNGFDNSGRAGDVHWQQGDNLARSTAVLKTMAHKYGDLQYAETVVGLQLVNEPVSWGNNNFAVTKKWAGDAYTQIVAVTANPKLMIVMHDAFQGASSWTDLPAQIKSGRRFGIDSHLYQCFIDTDSKLTQAQHIQKACGWSADLSKANAILPTFIGEWSPTTNICVNPDGSTTPGTSCTVPGCQCQGDDYRKWNDKMVEQVRRYVEAQMDVYEASTSGYFMWSFKGPGSWGFLNGIEKGFIPNPVTARKYGKQC